jgi:hypothetical protein
VFWLYPDVSAIAVAAMRCSGARGSWFFGVWVVDLWCLWSLHPTHASPMASLAVSMLSGGFSIWLCVVSASVAPCATFKVFFFFFFFALFFSLYFWHFLCILGFLCFSVVFWVCFVVRLGFWVSLVGFGFCWVLWVSVGDCYYFLGYGF